MRGTMGSAGTQEVRIRAMGAVGAMSGIGRIRDRPGVAERDRAVDVASEMRDVRVAKIERVHALRHEREGMKEIEVLRVGVETQRGLDFSGANAEPARKPVVSERPVDRRLELPELAEVPGIHLHAQSEL